jgi:hypothetical protein
LTTLNIRSSQESAHQRVHEMSNTRYNTETLRQLAQQQQMNRMSTLPQQPAIGQQLMSLQNVRTMGGGNTTIMNNQMGISPQNFSPTSMLNGGQGGPSSGQHIVLNNLNRGLNTNINVNTNPPNLNINNPQVMQAIMQLQQQQQLHQQQQSHQQFSMNPLNQVLFNKPSSPPPPLNNPLQGLINVNLYGQQNRFNAASPHINNTTMMQQIKPEQYRNTPPPSNTMMVNIQRPPPPLQDDLMRQKQLACNPDYKTAFISKQDIYNRLNVFRSLDYDINIDEKCKLNNRNKMKDYSNIFYFLLE